MLHAEIEKFSSNEASRIIEMDDVRGIVYAGAEYGAFDPFRKRISVVSSGYMRISARPWNRRCCLVR